MARNTKLFLNNKELLMAQYGSCQICGRRKGLEVHHKTPLAKGGTDEIDNLILLCDICHHKDIHTSKDRSELIKLGIKASRIQEQTRLFSLEDLRIAYYLFGYLDAVDVFDIIEEYLPVRGYAKLSKPSRYVLQQGIIDEKICDESIVYQMLKDEHWRNIQLDDLLSESTIAQYEENQIIVKE